MPPPPIPQRTEVAPEVKNEGSNPPPIPVRSPRRRPAGAVATAMVSGQGSSAKGSLPSHFARKEEEEEDVEDQEHANNPYDLKAMPGSSVTASYPFRGDENLQQLSFAVGDVIKLKQKEDMWSWGVLERSGKEGWFPHNYVGTTFKPLPGIHEMAAKIRERRERLDAAQAKEDAAANPKPAPDGQSASDVQVDLPDTGSSGSAAVTDGDASEEARSLSKEALPGSQSAVESTDTSGAAAAQAGGGAVGGSVADADGAEEESGSSADPSSKATQEGAAAAAAETSSKSATTEPQISSAPSLPPFFKASPAANDAAAVVAPPTTGAVGEATAAEVVEGAQIDGVGFAGQADAASTGCKCSIM